MVINGREVKVAAIDFDGTLFTEDAFPEVGRPIPENIFYVKTIQSEGVQLILWTNREGKLLEDAVEACKSVGLEFDAINQNLQWRIDMYGNDCRKIGADIYLDDKAINPADREIQYTSFALCDKYYKDMCTNKYFNIAMNRLIHKQMTPVEVIHELCAELQEILDQRTREQIFEVLQEVER